MDYLIFIVKCLTKGIVMTMTHQVELNCLGIYWWWVSSARALCEDRT